MGQHKSKERYVGMGLAEELQARINDISKIAEGLVDNRMAGWQVLEMPSGEKVIAFTLPIPYWTLKDGKIVFVTRPALLASSREGE